MGLFKFPTSTVFKYELTNWEPFGFKDYNRVYYNLIPMKVLISTLDSLMVG